MGFFDDIVPLDTAPSYVATPLGVPRITVRPKGVEPPSASPHLDDMPTDAGLAPDPFEPWDAGETAKETVAPSLRTRGLFDDIVAPAAQHKAAVERALSTTVPLRLQHPHSVEIAAGLMADHGVPLSEALDRAMMRLHAQEGTAQIGRISDVIGKDVFDEAQRAPASPDIAPPAPGVGWGHAATEAQARPDGEYASGDLAAQDGDAAGREAIGSEDAALGKERAQSGDESASAAVEGRAGRLTFGDGDKIVARTSGQQHLLPTIERIGERIGDGGDPAAHGELDPEDEEEPPDKGPLSDDRKQSDLLDAPRPKGGVSDSAADVSAIDFFNQLAASELAQSQALTDFVQQHPKAAAAEGALGLGVVLGIPAAGAAGLLGAGAAAARASGPGAFISVSESMSAASAAYQARVAGSKAGTAYVVKGVKFDGFTNGVLIDAKAGYARFVEGGMFRPWFRGKEGFIKQANDQLAAANGTPIQWRFAEEAAANATRTWFKEKGILGIDIVHVP